MKRTLGRNRLKRRVVKSIATGMLVLMLPTCAQYSALADAPLGDINGDGRIGAADAAALPAP
jgi:hypothetical protein